MAALAEVATRGERIADGCVLIRARTDGTVTAAASNLSWSVVLSLGQAEVAEAGEVMVLAGKLREDISRRRGELVTLSTEADTLLVIDEESRFGHATHHAGDFLHRTPPAALAQVNGAVLLGLAERAVVAGDEVSFPGVRLEADGNGCA
jgi:DNA polymerase III sliding clamp (beta) subunit (PCNA family)